MVKRGSVKIVINRCYGGFSLSHKAVMEYAKLKGITLYVHETPYCTEYTKVPWDEYKGGKGLYFCDFDIPRDDPMLVQVVETLGKEANGDCAELDIVEIPSGIDWIISEYAGMEHIAESHRTWY